MYLVPAADNDSSRLHTHPQPSPPVKPRPRLKMRHVAKRGMTDNQHPHDKWVALRTKLLEADITVSDLIHKFAVFLRKVLPQPAPQKTPQRHLNGAPL